MANRIKVFPLDDGVKGSGISLDELKQQQNRSCELESSWDILCLKATQELRNYFRIEKSIFIRSPESSVRGMKKLLFYRLVIGGNVPLVLRILDSIQDSDPLLYRCVLLGKAEVSRKPDKTDNYLFVRCSKVIATIFVYMVVLLPSYLLMTPIFYVIHFLTYSWNIRCKGSSSDYIRLPLLFAALSNNVDLVQLFCEHQPKILTATDESGCNIFHYLAHLSADDDDDDSRSVNSCFDVLLRVFGASAVRTVLLKCRNDRGLSGLELAVLIGSPLYFTKVLETEGIFRETKMILGFDKVFVATDLLMDFEGDGVVTPAVHINSSGFALSHYDVSLYEDGDVLQEQNFLLSLLCTRDLMSMNQEEVSSIMNCLMLKNWIDVKIKTNSLMVNLVFLLNSVMWVLLVLYLDVLTSLNEYSLLKITYWLMLDGIANSLTAEITNSSKCQQPSSSDWMSNNNNNTLDVSAISFCKMSEVCGFDVESTMNEGQKDLGFYQIVVAAMLISASVFVVTLDGLLRLTFLHLQYFCHKCRHLRLSIIRVFRRRIPMSYIGRQLSIFSCCLVLMTAGLKLFDSGIEVVDTASAKIKLAVTSLLIIVVLLGVTFRVLSILYGTRVHSIGGHFVISMCKMGKVLVQFSILFFTVASAFSTTFKYIVFDPECPAKKKYPFDQVMNAIFGTFRLMMGDNTLPDPMSEQVAIAYSVYVIISSVIMLSLLTGLSGSVADRVLSEDLRDVLMLLERLEESIDVETTLLFVAFPWRRFIHRWRCRRTLATSMIFKSAKKGNERKIIIEVEHFQD